MSIGFFVLPLCSSPAKVGLIEVGTEFAQSRLAWSEIAYGIYDFYGNGVFDKKLVANANLAPYQSAQVIMEQGMWNLFLC